MLATRADVVLMDLRGWQASHRGATFELLLAMERVPLSRIVLLTDRHTDERGLTTAMECTWSQLAASSLNARVLQPYVEVVRCSGRRQADAGAIANCVFVAAQSQPIGSPLMVEPGGCA